MTNRTFHLLQQPDILTCYEQQKIRSQPSAVSFQQKNVDKEHDTIAETGICT
jgi:hypothetical protein